MIAGAAAVCIAAALFFPVTGYADSSKCEILLDPISERVIFEKNSSQKSLIASTTKIMTALLICEQCNVLDSFRIPAEAVGIEGSSMYLREGEVLTLQELLYGMMLSSGNDAAVALAVYCSGNQKDFAELMNDKANALGLTDTHFVNPHGLDAPEHYSSARDLAVLSAYAMNNPIFAATVSAKNVNIGTRFLRNHNKLLWLFEGADGVKTGYTKAAGRILVSSAVRDNRRLIAVTIDDPNDWQDHKSLLENGFSRYHLQRVVTAGDVLGTVEIAGGTVRCIPVFAAEHFVYAIADGERPWVYYPQDRFAYAPVTEGSEAGSAYVMINGTAVGKIRTVYGATVEQVNSDKTSGRFRLWSVFRK